MSNPQIRRHMHDFPEEPDGPISELYEAEKMREGIPDDAAPPMIEHGGHHYYVKELAQLTCSTYFVPLRWYKRGENMWMVGHDVLIQTYVLDFSHSIRYLYF